MNKIQHCLAAANLLAVFCLFTIPAFAQNAPQAAVAPPPAAPPPQAGQSQPAPTPAITAPTQVVLPTSYAHHYLSQHITLTETDKNFFASRKELGCTFADGVSDKTVSTSVKFTVDTAVLSTFLTTLKPRIDSKATPAHPVLIKPFEHETAMKSDNVPRPAKIVPAEPNVELQISESVEAISDAITDNPIVTTIPLSVTTGPVPTSKQDLDGINARLSHFVTRFNPGEVGRTLTVRRAIELIDRAVLQPGDIFSINKTVGERTIARGFGIGKVFINGTMKDQVGGGMCQVATTLFNAALLANLKIIERHQHVRTVPYVPAGGDATVYYGQKDFKFQNNTSTPIYIYYKTYGRFCVCDLYGKGEPATKVSVVTIPTRLGPRYYKGVIRRFVTVDGKTTNNFTAFSTYKWTPSLDYLR